MLNVNFPSERVQTKLVWSLSSGRKVNEVKRGLVQRGIGPFLSAIGLIGQNTPGMPEKAKEEILKKGTLHSDEMFFVHHTSNGDKELYEELESRGTKRSMGLATILYDLLVHGVILPVDEIETSIHYELLSYFIKVFLVNSKRGGQLIASTHDINLLDEDYIRRDVIWFTDKNDCGETQLLRLSTLGLHKTLSVYNAYKQEKLVDLPFLDSIYMDMDEYYETEVPIQHISC